MMINSAGHRACSGKVPGSFFDARCPTPDRKSGEFIRHPAPNIRHRACGMSDFVGLGFRVPGSRSKIRRRARSEPTDRFLIARDFEGIAQSHGRPDNPVGPPCRVLPAPACVGDSRPLGRLRPEGPRGACQVLAGRSKHGSPGSSGPIPAFGARLFLDASSSDFDDDDSVSGVFALIAC